MRLRVATAQSAREVRDVTPGVHLLNQLGGGRALTLEDDRGQRVKLGRWHHPCAAQPNADGRESPLEHPEHRIHAQKPSDFEHVEQKLSSQNALASTRRLLVLPLKP